jgi:integrase-like protein
MPKTKRTGLTEGFDELLVIVDMFSKQTILIPTKKTATTEDIFHLMWERIFAVFGIPTRMLSDRDRIFKTDKWRQLMKDIGSEQVLSTAYHQRTDGQTERKIQEIMAYFRHYEQKNWTDSIPIAQYALNDAESSTTGHTPNFITFGTQRIGGTDKRDNEQQKNYKKLLRRETSGIVYFEGRGHGLSTTKNKRRENFQHQNGKNVSIT